MTEKDWNKIAQLEMAVAKRWGEETIQNPKATWTDEKEQEYKKQIKELWDKERELEDKEIKVKQNGFFITQKLLNRETQANNCPVCNKLARTAKDDVYIIKFECCFNCYIQWVEGREERWKTGWRPKTNGNNT
jgi:hypothetical protein